MFRQFQVLSSSILGSIIISGLAAKKHKEYFLINNKLKRISPSNDNKQREGGKGYEANSLSIIFPSSLFLSIAANVNLLLKLYYSKSIQSMQHCFLLLSSAVFKDQSEKDCFLSISFSILKKIFFFHSSVQSTKKHCQAYKHQSLMLLRFSTF